MDIEFKEKTFEKYFGHELAKFTNISFSPDQCDEFLLGFDEAFFLPEEWLFRVAPYVRRRRRAHFTGISKEDFDRIGKEVSRLIPPLKFNLFVQFKRPAYLISRGAKQWDEWGQSYYRYKITQHQQEALERIDKLSYGRAATLYASPAFWSEDDLWMHAPNQAIVENSNIASAGRLKGHGHYSYISPGFTGKGHSEMVDIESDPLQRTINLGLEGNEELPMNQHIKKTAGAILAATEGGDLTAPIFHRFRTAFGLEELDSNSFYDAMGIIEAFSEVFSVRVYALG
ncbi:hypothetical protein [Roseibium aggregatum]|uniref:hypothetical protein n=1 Tax=Roseibium aggregatum TaxID=187304 RepID=UPI001E38A6B4|nr:hypothetical protein [Roseibium aggregatum]UES36710.1 hypothetical protein GFC08_01910 [Roseibium aggregatum]